MFLCGGGLDLFRFQPAAINAAASHATTTRAAGQTIVLTAIDAIADGGYDCEPHR